MKTIPPTETLEKYINQAGTTTGPRKLQLFKLALALRGTPQIYSQATIPDPTVYIKVFDPCGSWTWFLVEFEVEGNQTFGLTVGHDVELGYIDLAELAELPGALGIGMEINVWFLPQSLSQAMQNLGRGQ